MSQETRFFFYAVVIWGIAFTVFLLLQQRNYKHDLEVFLRSAAGLEEELVEDNKNGLLRPYSSYRYGHENKRKITDYFTYLVEYGPYVLFGLTFGVLTIIEISGYLPDFKMN